METIEEGPSQPLCLKEAIAFCGFWRASSQGVGAHRIALAGKEAEMKPDALLQEPEGESISCSVPSGSLQP